MSAAQALVFDASALVALFRGEPFLLTQLGRAQSDRIHLIFPTVAIADAEAFLVAGPHGWEFIQLTRNVERLPLAEHTAIEVGPWPGPLSVRVAAHEARSVRGVVVTADPEAYAEFDVEVRQVPRPRGWISPG